MLRKAAETDVHTAGFAMNIGGLRSSDASQGIFDSLKAENTPAFFHALFDEYAFSAYGLVLFLLHKALVCKSAYA